MALILSGDAGITFPVVAGGTSAVQASSGKVLQVVQVTYSTSTSTSSGSYSDTGLTASITPSSTTSKILVLVNQMGVRKVNDTSVNLNLCRNGSQIIEFVTFASGTSSTTELDVGSCNLNYLDSPSSTSSVTYKTQFASRSGVATASVQYLSATSTITLMEIAA